MRSRASKNCAARWAATLAAVVSLAACASTSSGPAQGGGTGDTFTFAISAQVTLNPYTADQNPYNAWVLSLAYEPLIKQQADLSYAGDLVSSFKYTDDKNMVFVMNLRPNLTFADGTKLDAQAVVNSLRYFLKAGVNATTWGSSITSVTATGPLQVTVTNSRPNPDMPFVFSQASFAGFVISPTGLADPSKLSQQTFGAGPYVLNAAATIPNSKYVFTPNSHYLNPSGIHWKHVVAQVIADPSSSVKAVQAGQVDYIGSAVNLLPEIKAAGLKYSIAPAGVVGIMLADRNGTLAPALKDVRVRQALNYAIDRKAILNAIFAGQGSTTDQLNSAGWEGYDPAVNDMYPYDPAKARQLLAAAGYPHGFAITMLATQFIGQVAVAQAVADQWKQIGVTVNLTTDAQPGQTFQDVMTRKYATVPLLALNTSAYLLSGSALLPLPNPSNPFGTTDPQLSQMLVRASAIANPAARSAAYQQAIARVVDLAWFAPVVTIPGVAVGSSKITGWQNETDTFDITAIKPA